VGATSNDGDGGSFEDGAQKLVTWLTDRALAGLPPMLSSAEDLADQYLRDCRFGNHGQRIDALINWETSKNATTGFLTGLGGLIVLPIMLPAGFGASWFVQARMSGAIAKISGYDLREDRVQTFVVACLVGDALVGMLKASGIQIGRGLARTVLAQVPGRLLIEINKRVGFRLITKAGEKGAINLVKGIPFVGGVIGGGVDGYYCRRVGKTAKRLFYCPDAEGGWATAGAPS
jgi:hypothetical protein